MLGVALVLGGWLGSSSKAFAAPVFERDATGPLDPQPCAPQDPGCWTNHLVVADLDEDDLLDIVFVNYDGFFTTGTAGPLVVYRNDGGRTFTNVSATAVDDYVARVRQVALGDIDGDGDLDMFAPEATGAPDALFVNDGSGNFTDEGATRIGTSSRAGAARFGDFDDDGDLDLFVADGFLASGETEVFGHVYRNDGSGNFREIADAIPASVPSMAGADPDDVDLFDANRDFHLDIMLNLHTGDNALWLGQGDGTFVDASDMLPGQPNVYHYGPGVCDVDGDDDLDLWIDNMGPSPRGEQLLINDGTGAFTEETATRVSGNSAAADDNQVICADVDDDGDFDAIVMALSTTERVLQNDGNGNFEYVDDAFDPFLDSTLWGDVGDLDGDGRVDLVTGQGEGATLNQIYWGVETQPVDTRAPRIPAHQQLETVAAGDMPAVRFAVSDRVVTDLGPRLDRAFARVTLEGATQEVEARFVGGDLFHVQLPPQAEGAQVEVELCAVDRSGNEGCAPGFSYAVEEGEGTGSSGDSGSETSGDESDTNDDDATTGESEASTSGSETDTQGDPEEPSDGCPCGVEGSSRHPGWSILWGLFAVFGLRRRFRR